MLHRLKAAMTKFYRKVIALVGVRRVRKKSKYEVGKVYMRNGFAYKYAGKDGLWNKFEAVEANEYKG